MPGIHLCVARRGALPPAAALERALGAAAHRPGVVARSLVADGRRWVGALADGTYPVAVHAGAARVLVIEGRLYGAPLEDPDALAAALLGADGEDTVARWLVDRDGEFVLVAVERATGRLAVCTDALARLPIYAAVGEERVVVGRQLGWVARTAGRPRLDALALAESLCWLYPLGARTLVDGVVRVPPATLLRVERDGRVERRVLRRLTVAAGAPEPALDALVGGFRAAASARVRAGAGRPLAVSLSGGLDSRAVLGAVRDGARRLVAVTWDDGRAATRADVEAAQRLAGRLGVAWHRELLPAPTAADAAELLVLRGGQNPLDLAFLLPFLRRVAATLGPETVLVTGDGGDKLLPSLAAPHAIRDDDALAAAVVARHAVVPPATAAALLRLPPRHVEEALRARLAEYPEPDRGDRFVRFALVERARKWLFEGEDRNRGYLWSTTPFWSPAFVASALRVPAARKAGYALYRRFLAALDPALVRVPSADWGHPVDSLAASARLAATRVLARLPATVQRSLRRAAGRSPAGPRPGPLPAWLASRLERPGVVGDHLDVAAVRRHLPGLGGTALAQLATVWAAIEWLETGETTLGAAAPCDQEAPRACAAGEVPR
jgi:asparagine synthase (glutamine-hydrolysing)